MSRINRNILECKGRIIRNDQRQKNVLIETYWNVKYKYNVADSTEDWCINRNILECKGHQDLPLHIGAGVLIETYWNVRDDVQKFMKRLRSINRNILECKG